MGLHVVSGFLYVFFFALSFCLCSLFFSLFPSLSLLPPFSPRAGDVALLPGERF